MRGHVFGGRRKSAARCVACAQLALCLCVVSTAPHRARMPPPLRPATVMQGPAAQVAQGDPAGNTGAFGCPPWQRGCTPRVAASLEVIPRRPRHRTRPQAVIRQITASVTFLPLLVRACLSRRGCAGDGGRPTSAMRHAPSPVPSVVSHPDPRCPPRACAQLPSQPARALLESVDQGDGSIATPAAALPMFEVEEIR